MKDPKTPREFQAAADAAGFALALASAKSYGLVMHGLPFRGILIGWEPDER